MKTATFKLKISWK